MDTKIPSPSPPQTKNCDIYRNLATLPATHSRCNFCHKQYPAKRLRCLRCDIPAVLAEHATIITGSQISSLQGTCQQQPYRNSFLKVISSSGLQAAWKRRCYTRTKSTVKCFEGIARTHHTHSKHAHTTHARTHTPHMHAHTLNRPT